MRAIILSRRPHREYDEIISLFTYDSGRVEALAKGNKKIISKQSPFLEPGSIVECALIPGKEIDHLAKTQNVEYFRAIRSDEHKSRAAAWATTFTRALTAERVPDHPIFFALKSWLEFINESNLISSLLWDSYAMVLLRLLGFVPQLDECVLCHKPFKIIAGELLAHEDSAKPGIYFSGGGLTCGICRLTKQKSGEEIAAVGLQELNGFSLLIKGDWRLVMEFPLEKSETAALHRLVYNFTVYHTEVPLRDWGGN